jgi:hypothetical protein
MTYIIIIISEQCKARAELSQDFCTTINQVCYQPLSVCGEWENMAG